jgi:hypothetical protein
MNASSTLTRGGSSGVGSSGVGGGSGAATTTPVLPPRRSSEASTSQGLVFMYSLADYFVTLKVYLLHISFLIHV